MKFPVEVALAQAVTALPRGPGWWYEPKFDGHRMILWRTEETVRCQSRSGRDITTSWIDLAHAGMRLPPGCVIDGEAVIWTDGTLDFTAVQSRAAASTARARDLAATRPASYAAWDCLMIDGQDLRRRPYTERRAALLNVLAPIGPPLQPVPATDDPETALVWYEVLQEQGLEGVVAKPGGGAYKAGRIWRKIRHATPVDAVVVGYTGSPRQPRHLALRLPDGRRVRSQRLTPALATQAATYLRNAPAGRRARTDDGEPYLTAPHGLIAEVAAGTTRHAVVTVTRLRAADDG